MRSGGHSPNPGFASIDEPSILIDLQKLNQIKIREDTSYVSIYPRARWGEVYAALDTQKMSVVGGRVPDVGVDCWPYHWA
jgi:FAD/FMN-containing dehydrogenase